MIAEMERQEVAECDWLREIARAYEIQSCPVVKLSSVHSMRGGGRSAPELTALERHGQAALLLSYVARRCDVVQRSYLAVVAGRQAGEIGPLLMAVLAALPTGLHRQRAVEMCIASYAGLRQYGQRAIREAAGCSMHSVSDLQRQVWGVLDDLHLRTIRTLCGGA